MNSTASTLAGLLWVLLVAFICDTPDLAPWRVVISVAGFVVAFLVVQWFEFNRSE